MAKYFFEEEDAERCYDLETIKDRMRTENLKERIVFEAERSIGSEAFYCRVEDEVYEKSVCRECVDYRPRNGKNGICKSNSPVYHPSNEVTIKL